MTTAKTVNGRLKPYLDQQSTNVLNLTVLQRSDPFIQEILITISHVTLYEFNIELNQWSRKDVEGSLFVVRRNTQPQFQFIVMNRLNAENFVEHLVQDFEYEVQIPYLLYRNAAQKINGIWFYVTYDCEEVANLFSRLLGAQSKVYPNSQVTSRDSEMRELEAVPTSAVIEGPLEPEVTAACSRDQPVDSSLADFQSTAMRTGGYGTQDDIYSRQLFDKKAPSNSLSHVHDENHSRVSNISSSPVTSRPTPTMNLSDRFEPFGNSQPANLVKPSCFDGAGATPPMIETPRASLISSSSSVDYACHPLMIPQHQQLGTQMLQPFPPPTPSPTLPQHFNANLTPTSNYGQLNRERVHNALQTLVQDNQFIDIVYQALMKAHQS